MSATRRLALLITIALMALALSAASVLAQGGAPNPSGGTSCRLVYEDGPGSISLGGYLPRGLSINFGVQGWLNGYALSRYVVPVANRRVPTPTAVAPRRIWGR